MSVDAQVIDHHTAPDATERFWIRDAFTRRCGYRIAEITLSSKAQAAHAGAILDKKRRVQRPRHRRHVLHVVRVNDAGVFVAVLGGFSRDRKSVV